jgi:hypothetical protein
MRPRKVFCRPVVGVTPYIGVAAAGVPLVCASISIPHRRSKLPRLERVPGSPEGPANAPNRGNGRPPTVPGMRTARRRTALRITQASRLRGCRFLIRGEVRQRDYRPRYGVALDSDNGLRERTTRVLPRHRCARATHKLGNDVSLRPVRNVARAHLWAQRSLGGGYRATCPLHHARHGDDPCEVAGVCRHSVASSGFDEPVGTEETTPSKSSRRLRWTSRHPCRGVATVMGFVAGEPL